MINNLNRSAFMGYLGADAKQANSTAPVTFSIAVSSHWTDNSGDRQTRTDWQNIVVFGNLRKYAEKLRKGDRVYVEAEARTNNYERKIGTETAKFYETESWPQPLSGLLSGLRPTRTSKQREGLAGQCRNTAPNHPRRTNPSQE